MNIVSINGELAHKGLREPVLKALAWDRSNYKVMLMQPLGQIQASEEGVFNINSELADKQFGDFLKHARERQADLVVTPEYSLPWRIIIDSIKNNNGPEIGKIWALGCESIRYNDLVLLKQELSEFAEIIFEELTEHQERFVSPLVYVFRTAKQGEADASVVVMLIQFKTCPMGDDDLFEVNGMVTGTRVYEIGGNNNIKLVSLICADVFAFNESHALSVYDRALILNIQLNPKPRHEGFTKCRANLLNQAGDSTELICLNWSANIEMLYKGKNDHWNNIAGSAWYLRPDKFDLRDEAIKSNHDKGLYYTWLHRHKTHALFFNYMPAVYVLEATKVFHKEVPAALSRRHGPKLTNAMIWDIEAGAWIEKDILSDGFHEIAHESGDAKQIVLEIAKRSPLEVERVLAVSVGKCVDSENWHSVTSLDSCSIETTEIINRITFAQDTDRKAIEFRRIRLKRLGRLWSILQRPKLPASIQDLKDGFSLAWSSKYPHHNIVSENGKLATVVYLGEEVGIKEVEETANRIAYNIGKLYASDDDKKLAAKQRIVVWYRAANDDLVPYSIRAHTAIDQNDKATEVDFTRPA